MRALGIALVGLCIAISCGGESESDQNVPEAGSSGAGQAGSGAAAGTSAGSASGGSAGAFVSSGEAECMADQDCRIVENCCDCFPAPTSAEVAECGLTCEQSQCGARGLGTVSAVCRGNRCVFDVSCDTTQVSCLLLPADCPEGRIHSVAGNCFGPCVAPTECASIAGCDDCPQGSNQVCVGDDITNGHCVEVTSACAENPTCECVAACFAQCDDTNGIGCFCINC